MSITDELREWARGFFNVNTREALDDIADRIDAAHAQLERDYKVACEVNERQDEQYADMVHKLDRAYEKNRNQRKQLTEVQEALHRRNEGELKRRWMREKQDLELQIAKMHLESVELPEDADGEPIHIGDVLTDGKYTFVVYELAVFGDGSWSIRNEDGNAWAACDVTHHHEPTVEDVLCELLDKVDDDRAGQAEIIAEYAAKLRLAKEGE